MKKSFSNLFWVCSVMFLGVSGTYADLVNVTSFSYNSTIYTLEEYLDYTDHSSSTTGPINLETPDEFEFANAKSVIDLFSMYHQTGASYSIGMVESDAVWNFVPISEQIRITFSVDSYVTPDHMDFNQSMYFELKDLTTGMVLWEKSWKYMDLVEIADYYVYELGINVPPLEFVESFVWRSVDLTHNYSLSLHGECTSIVDWGWSQTQDLNFTFSTVPEPETVMMLIFSSIILLMMAVIRKKSIWS